MNSKYYLGAYMSINVQFWKEALSVFRGKVSLPDTQIYWCNYHISTFSNWGGERRNRCLWGISCSTLIPAIILLGLAQLHI
jgi:hypothetical protein